MLAYLVSVCKGWNKTNQFSYQFNLTLILLFTYSDTNRVKQNNICVKSQKWVDRRVFHAICAHQVWCELTVTIGTTRAQLIPLSSSRVVMHKGTGRFGHTPFRPQDNCGDVSATWHFGITLCPFRPNSYILYCFDVDILFLLYGIIKYKHWTISGILLTIPIMNYCYIAYWINDDVYNKRVCCYFLFVQNVVCVRN